MKKIFNLIAAATALTLTVSACSDVFAPAESSTQPEVAGTVEIIISNVTDYSFDVTIAPKGIASYYSYLVDNDEYYEGIDAATLYAVKYESIAQGNIKYGTGKESYSFTVETEPNTTYTVYAVAGSPQGNVGEIAYKTILTTDIGTPTLEDFATEGNLIELVFSEEVLPVEGKKVKADVYSSFALEKILEGVEGTIVEDYSEPGDYVIEFPDIEIPGSVYMVYYEAGTFEDNVGNPCPALAIGRFKLDKNGDVAYDDDDFPMFSGYGGHLERENYEFDTEAVPEALKAADIASPIVLTTELPLFYAYEKKTNVSIVSSQNGKTITYDYLLDQTMAGIIAEKAYGFFIPDEDIAPGDKVTITIPEGAIYDAFGNENEETVIADLVFSYGYTLDDIIGNYTFTCDEGGPYSMGIAAYVPDAEDEDYEEDVEKGYNVQFTSFRNFACLLPIKGVFDPDFGTLFVPDGQIFNVISGYYAAIGGYDQPYDLTFHVPAPGVVTCAQVIELAAYTATSYAGTFATFTNFVATRTPDEEPGEGGSAMVNNNLTFTPRIR